MNEPVVNATREPDYLAASSMHHLLCPECNARLSVHLSASVVIGDDDLTEDDDGGRQ